MNVLYDQNTNLLELLSLTDQVSGDPANSATVTVTLKDAAGVDIVGLSWPQTLAYVAGSSGDYRLVLPAALTLTPETKVTAIIDVDDGPDRDAHWEIPLAVKERIS